METFIKSPLSQCFFKFELTDDDEVEADGVVDARYEGNVVDNAGQSWWDHSDLKNQ